jgi:hypothetical protein
MTYLTKIYPIKIKIYDGKMKKVVMGIGFAALLSKIR